VIREGAGTACDRMGSISFGPMGRDEKGRWVWKQGVLGEEVF
jgi:hypothetical protein